MSPDRGSPNRGCLLLALVAVSPILVVGAVALAGIAFGLVTASLPFLFALAAVALVVAGGGLVVTKLAAHRRGSLPPANRDGPAG